MDEFCSTTSSLWGYSWFISSLCAEVILSNLNIRMAKTRRTAMIRIVMPITPIYKTSSMLFCDVSYFFASAGAYSYMDG